jgi:hypothetical protein
MKGKSKEAKRALLREVNIARKAQIEMAYKMERH